MSQSITQKHLGKFLESKLDFQKCLNSIFSKVSKTICLLWKIHHTLPRSPLLTICESIIRPHLDYGDIIYDQTCKASFHQKLDSVQYNAALPITGAIRETSKKKLYNEPGLETFWKRWYTKLRCFFKNFRWKCPKYLFDIIPTNISLFRVKHNFFQNPFFPSAVIEWNKLNLNIHNSERLKIFKEILLNFIRPSGSTIFICHNPKGVTLLTRLRLIWVIFVSRSSNIVFKILLTQSAAVVMILKRRFISFFTDIIFQMKDQLSWIS